MHTARAEFVRSEANGRAPEAMTDWVRALERPLLNTQAFLKSQDLPVQDLQGPEE